MAATTINDTSNVFGLSEGVSELKALTNLGNEASIRFHQALGWAMADVEDYAGPGRMRIVFTRSLTNR